MSKSFVIKGNLCQTVNTRELDLHENAYAVCVDGVSKGIFAVLPDEYAALPLYDYGDALIFPGMWICTSTLLSTPSAECVWIWS